MAKSEDFYVYFDSNASTFVKRVKEDLEPLKTHIQSLRDEMAALGEAGKSAGGSGGGGGGRGGGNVVQSSIAESSFNDFFGALDSAAAEILSVTKSLGTAAQYQKDSAEQQKKFLQNLNNALRGANRGSEQRDPKVAEYETNLQARAEKYQKSLKQYKDKSIDEVKASLRQSDELKGKTPEGVSSSTPQTVRLADVPQVAIDEAAFNRVVAAVEKNVQATKAVEQAINRLAKRTPRRGDGGGDDGGGGGSRRRSRDRYSNQEATIGLQSDDPQVRANSARQQLKRRARLESLYELKSNLEAGQDPSAELRKRALDGSKSLKKALLQGGEAAIEGVVKAIKSIERDFKRSSVPETSELKTIYDEAVRQTGRPDGRQAYTGQYGKGGKKGKRSRRDEASDADVLAKQFERLQKELAEAREGGASDEELAKIEQKVALNRRNIERLLAGEKPLSSRAEKKAANRAAAQAKREAEGPRLPAQERVERQALLDIPTNADEFRRRARSTRSGDRLSFDDVKKIAETYRQEGYKVEPSRTKKGLVENVVKAGAEYAENGATVNDLSGSAKKIATKIDKNLAKLVKTIVAELEATSEAEKAALDVLRQNAQSGGVGIKGVEPNALKTASGKITSKGRTQYGSIYGGDPEREAIVDRARQTLKDGSTRVGEAALRKGLALYAEQPDLDIFNPAFDAQVQGTSEEAKRARRALGKLRAIFTVLDQMSGIQLPGLKGDSSSLQRGIETRDASREARRLASEERSTKAFARQDLRRAELDQLTDVLPKVSINRKGVVQPRAGNVPVGEEEFKALRAAIAKAVKARRQYAEAVEKGATEEERGAAELRAKLKRSAVFDAYEKAFGTTLQTRDTQVDVPFTRKDGTQGVRTQRVRDYDRVQQAEVDRLDREAARKAANRERVAKQRVRNTGANLQDAADFGASDVRLDGKTLDEARQSFNRLMKRATSAFGTKPQNAIASFEQTADGFIAKTRSGKQALRVQNGEVTEVTQGARKQLEDDPQTLKRLQDIAFALGQTPRGGLLGKGFAAPRDPESKKETEARGKKLLADGVGPDQALARLAEIVGKPVEKLRKADVQLAKQLESVREIEAARELLARAGVRWSSELNKSLNEATSVEDLFARLKQLLQQGTLTLSAYNPNAPQARAGKKGTTTQTLDGRTIYGTPKDEPVAPFTPKAPKVLGTYDEVKSRLGGQFGGEDANLRKAQRILAGGVDASAREIGRLASLLAKQNLGITDYKGFKAETGLKGKDLLAEVLRRMGAGGVGGTGAGGSGDSGAGGGKKGRAGGGGGGDNRDVLERILAAINKIYEKLGAGVRVSGVSRSTAAPTQPGADPDAKLNTRRKQQEPKIFTTPEGRKDLFNSLAPDLQGQVQGANNVAKAVSAASAIIARGYASQAGAVAYFRDELKLTAKEAAKFEADVRAKVGDTKLAAGAKRGQQRDEGLARAADRKKADKAAKEREEARAQLELASAMSRVSAEAANEVNALKRLSAAGADSATIAAQQIRVYQKMDAELEKLGMKAQQRQQIIRAAMGGAGVAVSGEELKGIARSARATSTSDPAVQNGGKLGRATGDMFAMQARSAVETQFFGNHGFWSRMVNSTGTFIVRNFSAGLVFGITNAFQDAISQGVETQSTFVRISSALDDTGRSTDGLKQALSGLSQEYGVALKDVYTTAAGLTGLFDSTDVGNEKLIELTRIATQLQLISGGALNATEAMRSLASVTSSYGEIDTNVAGVTQQEIADILTVIQTRLAVNIEESIEGVARLSGQAKELGIEFANAATYVAAISKFTGQTGAASGEQFSRILASLQTGRTQNVIKESFGGDVGKGIAESLKSRDFTTAIDGILANYDKLNEAEKNRVATAIGGARQAAAVNGLLIKGAEVLETVERAQNSKGAADERAALISAQLRAEMEKARQGFVNFVTALVDAGALNALGVILKVVVAGLSAVNSALTALNQLGENFPLLGIIQNLGLALLGFVAIAKVATVAWANFQSSVAASQAMFAQMTGAAAGAAGAAGATAAAQSRAATVSRVTSLDQPVRGRRAFLVPDLNARLNGYAGAEREGTVRDRTERLRDEGTRYQRTLAAGALRADDTAKSMAAFAARQRALAQEALATGNATRAEALLARSRMAGALATQGAAKGVGAFGRGLAGMAVQTGAAMAGQIAMMGLIAAVVQGFSQLGESKRRWEEFYKSVVDSDPSKEEGFVADKKGFADKDREALGQEGGLSGFWKGFSNTAGILLQRGFSEFGTLAPGGKTPGQSWNETLFQVGGVVPQLAAGGPIEGAINEAQKIVDQKIESVEAASAKVDEINKIFDEQLTALNNDSNLSDQQRNIGAEFIEQQRTAAQNIIQRQALVAAGLTELDALTKEQLAGVANFVGQMNQWTTSTQQQVGSILAARLESLGIDKNSEVGRKLDELRGVSSRKPTPVESKLFRAEGLDVPESIDVKQPELTIRERQGKSVEILADALKAANTQVEAVENKSAEEREADLAAAEAAATAYDSALRGWLQGLLQDAQQATQIAIYRGDVKAFAAGIQQQAAALATQKDKGAITASDYTVGVQQLREQEYQENVNTQTRSLQLKKAQTSDSVQSASYDLQIAQASLALAQQQSESLGIQASAATIFNAELQVKQATLALTQARTAAAEAAKAKSQEAADKAAAARAARRELAITKIDPFREVAVARARLSAAYAEQREAAARFGRNSAEYYRASAQVIEAQREVNAALDRVVEANSNLAVAIAEAAGKTVEAAKIKLAEAQRKAREALKRGGKGSAEYKNAKADVVSAQAALRDAKLDDAIGTIDFQKEMGQITAQEAIKQLQALLQQKNLTEQQRRDLQLKIKGLQDELNSQFEGQWNIGDDIKLPTPYEMRRTLGIEKAQRAVGATASGLQAELSSAYRSLSPSPTQSGGTTAQMAQATQAIQALGTAIQAKGDYITNDNSTITVNGTDIGMVVKLIKDALGPQASQRTGTSTRRGT
jgi:hypothetical protein